MAIKRVNKDFELFQREFKKWQKLFGLTGYKVYFKYEPLERSFASINIQQENTVATVRLNSEVAKEEKPYQDIKERCET